MTPEAFRFLLVSQRSRQQISRIQMANQLHVILRETGKGRGFRPSFSHVGNTFRKCRVKSANRRLFPWQKHELSQPIVSFSAHSEPAGGAAFHFPSLTV